MSLSDEDRGRRRAAKRYNERIKLVATSMNAVSIAIMSVAVLFPAIATPDILLTAKPWILLLLAFLPHLGRWAFSDEYEARIEHGQR